MASERALRRDDTRVILHFDWDAFYASVIEAEDPSLKSKPLAVQQKQIIVTCNYEARRRGLRKLQLITEAKKTCPDVVIVLGEDLTRFRDASKRLYGCLREFSWNNKAERLGFDEVWMDVSDIIEYNVALLTPSSISNSFFHLSRYDPTLGFEFDGTSFAGHTYPHPSVSQVGQTMHPGISIETGDKLCVNLLIGSHLASYMRRKLEEETGYTASVGISTSKLLSKLIGDTHKPNQQTTLLPPYVSPDPFAPSNINRFMDGLDIGKVPGIGFKLAQKLRERVLERPPEYQKNLLYGLSKENVSVADVRQHPTTTVESFERLLGGPGSPRGIGTRVYGLVNGVDDSEVAEARNIPRQISIEDSYIRLDSMPQLLEQLNSLSTRLLERMRVDLTESDVVSAAVDGTSSEKPSQRWVGRPNSIRLTTRPRPPLQPDGTRVRSFKRISRSAPMPSFVFNLKETVEAQAEKLVVEMLVPLFKKLHPEKSGWNLSLVNVAATDMISTASDSKAATGRDIQAMFMNQDRVLGDFSVQDETRTLAEIARTPNALGSDTLEDTRWQSDSDGGNDAEDCFACTQCAQLVPLFAREAHSRFHQR